MNFEDLLVNGEVVGSPSDKRKKAASKWPKKKVPGSQKMRADYKKRIASKVVLRDKGKDKPNPTT